MEKSGFRQQLVDRLVEVAIDRDIQRRRADHAHERASALHRQQLQLHNELEETKKSLTQRGADLDRCRKAIGDGWHPLKCGGAALVNKGEVKKIRDGGDEKIRGQAIAEAEALLGWAIGTVRIDEWKRGIAAVDPIPF